MPEKIKPSQEETPLHEIVLKLMFEANKEKPAELAASDIFWKMSDPAVSERNITEVLNWLVSQRRVEKLSEKYSLDRIEFLDQRNIELGITVPDKEVLGAPGGKNPKNKKSTKEEIPLHDVVLKLMFEANKEIPAKLAGNDIFWKISDPAVSERNVTEVLNWLVSQRRVEHFAGKYTLDRFEFLDQKNDENAAPKKAVVKKTPKVVKSATETPPMKKASAPKLPPAPKLSPPTKATLPPKATPPQKKAAPKKTVVVPKEILPEKKAKVNVNKILLIVAAGLFLYTCYLLFSLNASATSSIVTQEPAEINSAQNKLEKLSQVEADGQDKMKIVEEKLQLLEEINLLRSEHSVNQNSETRSQSNLKGVVFKLLLSNSLILLLFGVILYRRD